MQRSGCPWLGQTEVLYTGGMQSPPSALTPHMVAAPFHDPVATSFSTRWSVFSLREALFARSTRWSSPTRASSAFDSTLMEMMLLGAFGGASSSTTATHYFAVCVDRYAQAGMLRRVRSGEYAQAGTLRRVVLVSSGACALRRVRSGRQAGMLRRVHSDGYAQAAMLSAGHRSCNRWHQV